MKRTWEKKGNNSLVPCFIQKNKLTFFLKLVDTQPWLCMSAPLLSLLLNAEHLLIYLVSLYSSIPIRVLKRHISRRKKLHSSSSTWTLAKITSCKQAGMQIFHDSCCWTHHRLWDCCTEFELSQKKKCYQAVWWWGKSSQTGTEHESSRDDSDCFCDSAERQSEIIAGLCELLL